MTEYTEARQETGPRFPDVEVQLTGQDGNAFAVMGHVNAALRRAGHADVITEYMSESMAGDYDHLLRTAAKWVTVL